MIVYEIISTGSKGNAVVINGNILIDCGVPFKRLETVKQNLRLVLLTHVHSDHFNRRTVGLLAKERPTLRWGCCEWMVAPLLDAGVDARVIDVYEPGCVYTYLDEIGRIRPERLPHNVPNCGYRLALPMGEMLFYATDTATLDGIQATNYDLYMIEANHTKDGIQAAIQAKRDAGEYAYEWAAAHNHLSREQAEKWLAENAGMHSRYVFLHQHTDTRM